MPQQFDIQKIFSTWLEIGVEYAWGLPLVFLLMGGGIYFVYLTKMKLIFALPHALKLIVGKVKHKSDPFAEGQISHFKALTNALSSTIGMGNIGGVALAIQQGGAGAIFWMWVAALFGMSTKFFECTLSIMYRGHDHRGEPQGGPMYVIEKAMHPRFHFLAILFSIAGLIGTLSLFNSNQLAKFVEANYSISPIVTASISSFLILIITIGGVRRIGQVTAWLVPSMCILYTLACLGVILSNVSLIPSVFTAIFREAFSGRAAQGGALGLSVIYIMQTGIKRAAFSNEAGMGSAPLAHGNAHTAEPIAEGLVAMIEPIIDTIIVCTMTALTILLAFPEYWNESAQGVLLTQMAFQKAYGNLGTHFLGVAVVLFSFSSVLGFANYNKKCFDYLTKGKWIWGHRSTFVFIYILTIFWGSLGTTSDVINLLDISFAFMALPNMIATISLAPKIRDAMIDYFRRYQI